MQLLGMSEILNYKNEHKNTSLVDVGYYLVCLGGILL